MLIEIPQKQILKISAVDTSPIKLDIQSPTNEENCILNTQNTARDQLIKNSSPNSQAVRYTNFSFSHNKNYFCQSARRKSINPFDYILNPKKKIQIDSEYHRASWISKIHFSYLLPFIKLCNAK